MYKPEIRKIFTLENAKSHVDESSTVIDAWYTEEGETILVLAEESKSEYLLMSYHIDALNPDWNNLYIPCIQETYIPKDIFKEMYKKIK